MPVSGVRLARTPDVDGIAGVTVRSWRHRLAGLVPEPLLASMDEADLAMTWASAILNPPTPGHRLLVAVDDDEVRGYTAIGPSTDPDADGATVELLALEVDPAHERSGHGSRLMAAAVDVARSAGATSASTWCALDDTARRAFLQSAGWGPDSAFRDVAVGMAADGSDMLVREVRLVTDLTDG
ncbi:MAG: GNAT family N-acetyltransferase [Actinomycetota bacterium]|nr:GNAT family N-acetyltransferase [Actinomycetota bacterium]